jgi:predicted MFS family arabinose efflux permease
MQLLYHRPLMSPDIRASSRTALAVPAGTGAAGEFRQHWRALCATVIGLCVGLPGLSNYGFSIFIAPLKAQFGWSVSDISVWVFFLMLGSCATSVFVGRLVDRHGARAVIMVAIALFAATVTAAAWMTGDLWQLRLIALLAGAIGPAVSLLAYSQAVNERFDVARGTALGLMAGGIAISSVLAPPLMQRICDTYGWRAGFIFMGAAALLAFPFAYRWLGTPASGGHASPGSPAGFGMSRSEALRAPIFWLIAAIALVVGVYSTGVIFNLMPFLTEAGLSRPTAASYLGLFGLFMVVGKLACGLMLDRLPVALIGALILCAQSVALIGLGLQTGYAAVAIAVIGFSTGGQIACSTYTIPRYVGMKAYGQVYGVVQIVGSAGVGTGPYLFSSLRELSIDYRPSLSVAAGLALLAACLYGSLGRYRMWPSGMSAQSPDVPAP